MDENILSALAAIPVADLTREEWLEVGMALREEGFSVATWDEWSRDDERYHPGECERLWNGFRGSATPVKGGSIIKLAQDRGWRPRLLRDRVLDWDSPISDDGTEARLQTRTPVESVIAYLTTLFRPDDHVGYCTEVREVDGRLSPTRGCCDRTCAELLASLRKYPDDLGATFGDWNESAGAWIRFNALDGQGVGNANVTSWRFALVESDTIPVDEQEALFRQLRLPIAAMVYSGGKSIHAIVHVDAVDAAQYRERVQKLYTFLESQGVTIDRQNSNPSRLSRMPGVTRNGVEQRLIATNIGPASWEEWQAELEGDIDDLDDDVTLCDYISDPEPPEEIIEGILRKGHKMLISGASKAGKSFLMMELAIAFAQGSTWLGRFKVKQSKVLYINLEIDKSSAMKRFFDIYRAMGIDPRNELSRNIRVWNLRGSSKPLDKFAPKIIRKAKQRGVEVIIVDPIYKVITGDENNASDMGAFCGQFDYIAEQTGCSMIYCHHHSKGAQGSKRAMDRASGSGVFARDPDAQLDIIELSTEKVDLLKKP
ncbi:MAG: AAA family ATPase, partial [Oscillospiraceae bacterium]|nr:AAA family ATPase [Oscillospiraceae bacterium]